MPRRVVVAPFDPRWADRFSAESKMVGQALGANCVAIHHIGSTAIPAIHAKPIIDLLIEVLEIGRVDPRNRAMEMLGYEAMGEYGIAGRRFFRKDDAAGIRTHHVHAFVAGCGEVRRHLAFRDFLCAHPEWAQRYSDLKRRLAEAHADNIDRYVAGKNTFIQEIDRMAARAIPRSEL